MNLSAIRANRLPLPVRRSAAVAVCVEKSSSSRELEGNPADNQDHHAQQDAAATPSQLCRFGASDRDPFRDSPRFNAAFVAQVLGQVMMEGCTTKKPGYTGLRRLHLYGPLLDRRV